MYHFLTQERV